MCIEIAHNPGSLDTLAMPASCILQRLALLLLVLYICLSGLLILFPSTASTKLTAHKNTHRMFVCFVCLDRQEVPWAFGDNFLVKLCIFSFHVWKKKKRNKLASLQLPPFFLSLFPAVETNLLLFFFFKSPTRTHNQSAYKPTFAAQILHRGKKWRGRSWFNQIIFP